MKNNKIKDRNGNELKKKVLDACIFIILANVYLSTILLNQILINQDVETRLSV